jgi:hypothetical protein
MPCLTAAARAMDFSRIDFGWLGRFGGGKARCAGPDVWEYVASRAAAWDCPVSLRISLDEVASNPLAADCLDVIKIWEDAKTGNHLTDDQRDMLKNVSDQHARYVPCFEQRGIWDDFQAGREMTPTQRAVLARREEHHLFVNEEHHLFVNEERQYELVQITEVGDVADSLAKAYLFQRDDRPEDTYVLVWATVDAGRLRLPVPNSQLSAMRPFGTGQPVESDGEKSLVLVAGRTYLVFRDTLPDEVQRVRSAADWIADE